MFSPSLPLPLSAPEPLGPLAEKQLQLRHAAEQFEAMLLARWWRQMRNSGLGSDCGGDPTYTAINATGMEAVTMAMARAGGIGLAKMMEAALAPDLRATVPIGQQHAQQRDATAAPAALKSAAAEPIMTARAMSQTEP